MSPFLVMFQTFFTRRALNRYLGTRALQGHPRHLDTRGTWALVRHLGTRTLKALGHLGSQALRHSGTRRHLGTQALRHPRHFI